MKAGSVRMWVALFFVTQLGCAAHRGGKIKEGGTAVKIETSYQRARQLARARGVPLLICSGGPWSHYWRWMRATVFSAEALGSLADRTVPLLLDAEAPENAAFYEKVRASPWISILILDANTEQTLVRYDSEASVRELTLLVDSAMLALNAGAAGFEAQLSAADLLFAQKNDHTAAQAYEKLADEAPVSWKHRSRAIASAMMSDDVDGSCARVARRFIPTVSELQAGYLALKGLECALDAPPALASRLSDIEWFEKRVADFMKDGQQTMPAIEHSQMFRELVRAREEVKDATGASQVAATWWNWLEHQSQSSSSAAQREVFDVHRVIAANTVNRSQLALAPLLASQSAFPNDYGTHSKLSGIYRKLGRLTEALKANDEALKLAYGAYRGRILLGRAETLLSLGRFEEAISAATEAVRFTQALNQAQVPEWQLPQLQSRLREMQKMSAGAP